MRSAVATRRIATSAWPNQALTAHKRTACTNTSMLATRLIAVSIPLLQCISPIPDVRYTEPTLNCINDRRERRLVLKPTASRTRFGTEHTQCGQIKVHDTHRMRFVTFGLSSFVGFFSSLAAPFVEFGRALCRVWPSLLSSLAEPFVQFGRALFRVWASPLSSLAAPFVEFGRALFQVWPRLMSSLAAPFVQFGRAHCPPCQPYHQRAASTTV
jgi:hypothetical protein